MTTETSASENTSTSSTPLVSSHQNEIQNATLSSDRQTLINTAAKFLKNPKVIPTSVENKKLFLLKKGLTESEIKEAFKLAGENELTQTNLTPLSSNNLEHKNFPTTHNINKQIAKNPSIWSRIFKWIRNILIAGCLSYTAYKLLIKKYLFNNFNGSYSKSSSASKLENVPSKDDKLNESIREMRTTLNTLKETVETMNNIIKQINSLKTLTSTNEDSGIKTEIQSIKSLLLSRTQFPNIPSISPVIPSWQLESKANNNSITKESNLKENEHSITSNALTSETSETNEKALINGVDDKDEDEQ